MRRMLQHCVQARARCSLHRGPGGRRRALQRAHAALARRWRRRAGGPRGVRRRRRAASRARSAALRGRRSAAAARRRAMPPPRRRRHVARGHASVRAQDATRRARGTASQQQQGCNVAAAQTHLSRCGGGGGALGCRRKLSACSRRALRCSSSAAACAAAPNGKVKLVCARRVASHGTAATPTSRANAHATHRTLRLSVPRARSFLLAPGWRGVRRATESAHRSAGAGRAQPQCRRAQRSLRAGRQRPAAGSGQAARREGAHLRRSRVSSAAVRRFCSWS